MLGIEVKCTKPVVVVVVVVVVDFVVFGVVVVVIVVVFKCAPLMKQKRLTSPENVSEVDEDIL